MVDIHMLTRDEGYDTHTGEEVVSELDVRRAELLLGVQFPVLYKEFLIKYNGGSFIECVFHESKIGSLVVAVFFSLRANFGESLVDVEANMREFLPRNSIPFADDPGGNVFYMNSSPDGEVLFWDHETRESFLLAHSFKEFIEKLVPDS